jgi:glycosyltransferase involved in cell wall biosynthesis
MVQRSVLIAAPHHWTSPFQVGGQHLARAFAAAGWRVAYVSNPISPAHLSHGWTPDLKARAAIWRSGGLSVPGTSIWTYVPAALATPASKPLLRSRWVHRNWGRLSIPNVVRKVRQAGFRSVDLILIDAVVQAFWLDAVPHRRSALRIADRMSAFGHVTAEMGKLEADLAKRVDLVVYPAEALASDVRRLAPRRMLQLPNGVDIGHFSYPIAGDMPEPADLKGIPRPIAIYVGALDTWFDWRTLNDAAGALPEVSFVLIGPAERAQGQGRSNANIHILGQRPYGSLPAYLRHADVGLIPFDLHGHRDLVQTIHPLKLYEYFASGLPVVATAWTELERMQSPAILADSSAAFVDGIRMALARRPDESRMSAFVASAGWSTRLATLLGALDLDRT